MKGEEIFIDATEVCARAMRAILTGPLKGEFSYLLSLVDIINT